MVSTLDFESSDPSSNLGRTYLFYSLIIVTPWRNGSASDSRSEGCVFESRRGQKYFVFYGGMQIRKDSQWSNSNFVTFVIDLLLEPHFYHRTN